MDVYGWLLFIHIMALVFWLGTDVGVFVLGKHAQDPQYSVEARMLLLKVALILDMMPRIFMVITIPTGYQMAVNSGALVAPEMLTPAVWIFSIAWLAVVTIGLAKKDTSLAASLKKIEKLCLCTLLASLAFLLLDYAGAETIIQPLWLAGKVLLYGMIIIIMFFLEAAFIPAVMGFLQLEAEGSSDALEMQIRSGMDKTYFWVLAIYAAVLASAFLGVMKFT